MAGWEYRQATGRGAQVLSSATDQRAASQQPGPAARGCVG